MGNSSSTEEEGTAEIPGGKQLLADTTISTLRDGGQDEYNDEGATFTIKSDTGGSTGMRMTRPSSEGSAVQEEKNDIDCPTAMTDMAHDGDDEASIEQRRVGRRRFMALQTGSLGAEESMLLLGDSCDNVGGASSSSSEAVPKKHLVVPSVDVTTYPVSQNDENNARGLVVPTTPGLLVVPAVDVDQNQLFVPANNLSKSNTTHPIRADQPLPFRSMNENIVQPVVGTQRGVTCPPQQQPQPDPKPGQLQVVVGSDVTIQPGNFHGVDQPQGGSRLSRKPSTRSSSDDSGVRVEDKATKNATAKPWIGVPAYTTADVEPEDREVVEICEDMLSQRDDDVQACESNCAPLQLEDVEGVDMDLVRACQSTFVDFLSNYPRLAEHPGVETMLILKLQKIFSVAHQVETDLQERITALKAQKEMLAQEFHTKLILATRQKAARKLELQHALDKAQCQTGEVQKLVNHSLLLDLRAQARRLGEIRKNEGPVRSLDQPVNVPQEYLSSIRKALGKSKTFPDLSELASKTAVLRGKASSFTQKAERLRAEAEQFSGLNATLCNLSDDKLSSLAKTIGKPIL